MHRITRSASILTVTLASIAVPLAMSRSDLAAGATSVGGGAEVITVNFRGTGHREPSAPEHFVWSTDVYSMATSEKIGTATHDVVFTGPGMADHVITFRLPGGQLVSQDKGTFAADPGRAGFFHVGVHPDGNTILPDKGTGAYAGRTGRLRMSGWHDGRAFPDRVGFDDFYWIELDRER